jgi:hypothetical protein
MEFLKNHKWLVILAVVFILSRASGLGQLYHQDEYRWVTQVYEEVFGKVASPHPPVMLTLFAAGGKLFGYENLRLVPFLFGLINLLLVYAVTYKVTNNKKIGYLAAGLYTVNVYSLIASLMLDIDGTLMPFLVLLAYYLYLVVFQDGKKKYMWPLVVVMLLGIFTKLSYVLFVGALAVEYLWQLNDRGRLKLQFKKIGFYLGIFLVAIGALYFFYGKANPRFVEYALNFKIFNFASRKYFDLALRLFKFVIWLSPLLLLPMVSGLFKKEIFKKYRVWYIYTLFNFLFYLVIFDFATLPVERYFMFIIAPAVFISAEVIYSFVSRLNKRDIIISAAAFLALFVVTMLVSYEVVPLNPKEAYVNKVKDLNFNFLIPLTGGSGPIGFYGSAQFILWTWLACVAGIIFSKKKILVVIFLVFGVGYNILLSTENITGIMYGNVNNITKRSVDYVINNPEIKGVITYYDAGVYYLKVADKYDARFYTAPNRDYTERMNRFRGHYMIVDFPAIDKNGLYWNLISKCKLDKKFTDKYVDSYIFDCRSLPFAKAK